MENQNILITGGTGSFGQAFAKRCLDQGAKRVAIYSRSESLQAEMADKFQDSRLRFFIGDVRDVRRLTRAFEDVDYVIHAAALKRIEVGHYNPGEMVKTNILGAMNVIDAAHDAGVHKVVALSTDKAFQPISAYGQTKAVMESLFLAANNARGEFGPHYTVTRYGNVAGSRGSIIPKWKEILKTSDTVPVTDPLATRFWMTMKQAVDLVQDAMSMACVDEILYPTNLPAYCVHDLAVAMGAKMKITGLPSYEKMHESLAEGYSSDITRCMSITELREAIRD